MKEKLMKIVKDKQNWLILALILIIVLLIISLLTNKKEETKENDAIKFASEYTEVGEDNLYVYRTYDELIKIYSEMKVNIDNFIILVYY